MTHIIKNTLYSTLSFVILIASINNAHAQLTPQKIEYYLQDSTNLINENSRSNPDSIMDFLDIHLSDTFKFIDHATLDINGTKTKQPVARDKNTYIEEALSSLYAIVAITPKLDIKHIKVSPDGLHGSSKYRLKVTSKIHAAPSEDKAIVPITLRTDSQCTETYIFHEKLSVLQSEKLICKSQITFQN